MRPSQRLTETLRVLAITGATVITDAAQHGAPIDKLAATYALEALEACHNWRRDTTEASRRIAYANAHATHALLTQPGARITDSSESYVRAALHSFAQALRYAVDSNVEGACDYADRAQRYTVNARALRA